MRPIAGGVCSVCGERLFSPYAFSGEQGEPSCGLCRRLEPPFAKATAYGSYDGGLRDLIQLLKYEQMRPAANVLGRMLAEAIADLESSFGEGKVLVVPVPLHRSKLRQRGFNQSELIARAALKLKPAGDRLVLNANVLERRFAVTRPDEVAGRETLLVDDVFTTGTTVSECARLLRRAGVSKVWVATVARTLKADAAHAEVESEVEAGMRMAAHG
ncbi:MAG: hypothetical protein AUG13_05415 [Chloroflexi bacterium 13_1_20CM_2_59_7]|nr:MAG: hypothetical protein AUG13_05415 [Chloroflexi bacterium 13_1_20CM_2_59_7]